MAREMAAQSAAKRARSRQRLFDAQGGICPWCSLPLPGDLTDTAIDHIIPRCRGGPDLKWNRQLLHRRCNHGPGGKGRQLTEEAIALAAEHRVTLREPPPPPQFRGNRWTGWWPQTWR